MPLARAETPFLFHEQLGLVEMTGLKAGDLEELSLHLKEVPESSVFYHTHHYLQQHQFLTPEPPNDFAYWVSNVLQEEVMGEKLAAIDTVRYVSLGELRNAIVAAIDGFLDQKPVLRKAPPGEEFYFMKSVLFNVPTSHAARDLKEFMECLKHVSIGCLYNHVFAGRLRAPLGVDDFSNWLETALKERELAKKIAKLDPYTYTMEGLRKKILDLVARRLKEEPGGASV
jgi:hypothetical protein